MKKVFLNILLPTAVFALVLTGCSKKEDKPSTTQPAVKGAMDVVNKSDADGIFGAVNTVTTQTAPIIGEIEINLGTAVAAIFTATGGSTYTPMGVVTCDDSTLTKQTSGTANNSYLFQPTGATGGLSGTNSGISFSGQAAWNVTGEGTIPAFTFTASPFPTNPKITSEKEAINRNADYTFTITQSFNADSVLFVMASGNSYIQKTVVGNTTSVTFTAAELGTLEASSYGLLQVSPYTIQNSTVVVPGKKIYFVNMVTVSDFAEFK